MILLIIIFLLFLLIHAALILYAQLTLAKLESKYSQLTPHTTAEILERLLKQNEQINLNLGSEFKSDFDSRKNLIMVNNRLIYVNTVYSNLLTTLHYMLAYRRAGSFKKIRLAIQIVLIIQILLFIFALILSLEVLLITAIALNILIIFLVLAYFIVFDITADEAIEYIVENLSFDLSLANAAINLKNELRFGVFK
jgi:heme A synthase